MGLSSASPSIGPLPDPAGSTWQLVSVDNTSTTGLGKWKPVAQVPSKRHRRGQTEGYKRLSVFRSRSKTNTMSNLTMGHRLSPSLSIEFSDLGNESDDKRPQSGWSDSDHSDSPAKSWVSRGSKMLKKQNSKFNLSSSRPADWVVEDDEAPETQSYSRGHGKHGRMRPSGNDIPTRLHISKPYNFQHLTHTQAQQFSEIHNASQDKLATEFSAIRASQPPRRELQGIRAEDLSSRLMEASRSTNHEPVTPPSLSPTNSRSSRPSSVLAIKAPGTISYSRPIDNFSQPSPKTYKIPRSPTSLTTKTSSHNATHTMPDSSDHHHARAEGRELVSKWKTSLKASTREQVSLKPAQPPEISQTFDNGCLPHAITTPDDVAFTLQPPMTRRSTLALADVPEEDELHSTKRASMESTRRMTADSMLRHAKSFPSNRLAKHRRNTSSSGKSMGRPDSALIEGSQGYVIESEDTSMQCCVVRPMSIGGRGVDPCWEDDIDYCYQHEAEADCDFDWDRISVKQMPMVDEMCNEQAPSGTHQESSRSLLRSDEVLGSQRQAHETAAVDAVPNDESHRLPRLQTSLPDLDFSATSSAKSSMASLRGPVTPLQQLPSPRRNKFVLQPTKSIDAFNLDSSSFFPHECDTSPSHEDSSQLEFGWGDFGAFHQLSCNHPAASGTNNSARSSRPSLSKYPSSESVTNSHSTFGPRTCGNTASSGSLEEVACSKNYHQNTHTTARQIADRMAVLSVTHRTEDPKAAPMLPCRPIARKSSSESSHLVPKNQTDNQASVVLSSPKIQDHSGSMAAFATRLRSNSLASSSSGSSSMRASRVSYSLFPPVSSPSARL